MIALYDKLEYLVIVIQKLERLNINSKSLLEDPSGISLFFFYYSLLSKKDEHYDFAFDTLEKVAEEYTDLPVNPTSISKFGWLLYHLNQQEIIETDLKEFFNNTDTLLQNSMIEYLQKDIYDFLHGALDIVLYFLSENSKKAGNYVSDFIDEFEKKAKKQLNLLLVQNAVTHFLRYYCHLAM